MFAHHLDRIARTYANGRRTPLTDAVEGQDSRVFKWTREERACGVALVVLGEDDWRLARLAEGTLDDAPLSHLLFQPHRYRGAEAAEAFGRVRQVGFEESLELSERLLVEGDVIQVARLQAGLAEAVPHGLVGKVRVVFLPRESFFLSRGNDLPVHDDRRRRYRGKRLKFRGSPSSGFFALTQESIVPDDLRVTCHHSRPRGSPTRPGCQPHSRLSSEPWCQSNEGPLGAQKTVTSSNSDAERSSVRSSRRFQRERPVAS